MSSLSQTITGLFLFCLYAVQACPKQNTVIFWHACNNWLLEKAKKALIIPYALFLTISYILNLNQDKKGGAGDIHIWWQDHLYFCVYRSWLNIKADGKWAQWFIWVAQATRYATYRGLVPAASVISSRLTINPDQYPSLPSVSRLI